MLEKSSQTNSLNMQQQQKFLGNFRAPILFIEAKSHLSISFSLSFPQLFACLMIELKVVTRQSSQVGEFESWFNYNNELAAHSRPPLPLFPSLKLLFDGCKVFKANNSRLLLNFLVITQFVEKLEP